MHRLSTRETTLIVVLALVLLCAGYYLAFYTPVSANISAAQSGIEDLEGEMTVARAKLQRQGEMEAEIRQFEADESITMLPAYDNSKAIMNELNAILATTLEYSLSFSESIGEKGSGGETLNANIVRHTVSMQFACQTYRNAYSILDQLRASHFRSLVESVAIYQGSGQSGAAYNVQATVVYYDYID